MAETAKVGETPDVANRPGAEVRLGLEVGETGLEEEVSGVGEVTLTEEAGLGVGVAGVRVDVGCGRGVEVGAGIEVGSGVGGGPNKFTVTASVSPDLLPEAV